MCRNIRSLYNFDPPATDEEVRSAALQYVRKISGFTKPSKANEKAFEQAVDAVAEVSARLLGQLVTSAPPKDREVEAAKARARAASGSRPSGPWGTRLEPPPARAAEEETVAAPVAARQPLQRRGAAQSAATPRLAVSEHLRHTFPGEWSGVTLIVSGADRGS